jgi:hypothetical protein
LRAFASVGVTPVIKGCDVVKIDVEDGSEDVDEDVDGKDGSDDFLQPDNRIAANNAKINKMQISVFGRIAVFSQIRYRTRKMTAIY